MNQPPPGHNPYQPQAAPPAAGYNPYAPPSEPAQLGAPTAGAMSVGTNMWRDGERVVVPREGAVFPDRCIQCNAPTGYKLERKLYWHPGWVYVMILLNIWIYIVVALVIRKKAHVHLGLCDEHRAKRKNAILLGWVGSAAMVATCTGGLVMDSGAGAGLAGISVLGVMIFAIVGLIRARTVVPKKMDETYAWLKVGAPFLASLGGGPGQPAPPAGVVQY